jgi:hypothetical protein
MNLVAKILNKIFANPIQNIFIRSYRMIKLSSFQEWKDASAYAHQRKQQSTLAEARRRITELSLQIQKQSLTISNISS